MFFLGSLVILSAFVMISADPHLMPTSKALVFEGGNFAVLMLVTFVVAMLGVSIHEIAHATAARSVGCHTRCESAPATCGNARKAMGAGSS